MPSLDTAERQLLESRRDLIFNLGFNPKAWAGLEAYLTFLWGENLALNLISRKMTFSDLVDNHVIDCMLPLAYFQTSISTVADLGSGGGLPAVLYALQFPEVTFSLYEKSPLKQKFLNDCRYFAPNLEVRGEIPVKLDDFDLITARGFKPIDVILQMTSEYFKRGGHYFLLKGRREKISEEIDEARKKYRDLKAEIYALRSPILEVERHLVLISKEPEIS